MALFIYTLVVIWFHQTVINCYAFRSGPGTPRSKNTFADMLTTLRRVSYQ